MDATTEGEEGDGETVNENGGDDHEGDDRLDGAGEDFLLVCWRRRGLRERFGSEGRDKDGSYKS